MSADGKAGDWPAGLQHAIRTSGAARGTGTPLPETLRMRLESHLGADLSDVRVHTNSAVVDGHGTRARAFTAGQDIYFRSGAYNPHSAEGQALLVHELTHTVQQGAGPASAAPFPNAPTPGTPTHPAPMPFPYPILVPRPKKDAF